MASAKNKLKVKKVTSSDIAKIKNLLGSHNEQYYDAWSIENAKTQQAFTDFINRVENPDRKLLWHGSANENWWHILNSGLMLHPNKSIITGKMFGNGIYLTANAEKSTFFTSVNLPNKRGKLSNTSFIGLYEVVYGTPYHVYSYNPAFVNMNYANLQRIKRGAHCIHAHSGEMLKNDEIVVYNEDQLTIRYLVELR